MQTTCHVDCACIRLSCNCSPSQPTSLPPFCCNPPCSKGPAPSHLLAPPQPRPHLVLHQELPPLPCCCWALIQDAGRLNLLVQPAGAQQQGNSSGTHGQAQPAGNCEHKQEDRLLVSCGQHCFNICTPFDTMFLHAAAATALALSHSPPPHLSMSTPCHLHAAATTALLFTTTSSPLPKILRTCP
jgi:hypothetical protein